LIDVIVIGAGIAGASTAFSLKKRGLNPLVLEKKSVCSGGSAAAGAFLSPKISKPSLYKNYLNHTLKYALKFYTSYFPQLLQKNGLLKLPIDEEDQLRCKNYEAYIDFPWQKQGNAYFFPEAGMIPPHKLCQALLENIDLIESYEVKEILHDGEVWHINGEYQAKYVVLATGDTPEPFSLPYLKSKKIGGYRYNVTFSGFDQINHNIHKEVSLSTHMKEYLIVGATHIRGNVDLSKAAEEDSHHLLEKAEDILPMPDLKIIRNYIGYRRFSFDYFPFVGAVVNAEETIKAYPYIRNGTKVPLTKYHYFPNLYLHTALGSRGFVFAPYNAHIIAKAICDKIDLPDYLSPALRFQKWARKSAHTV
jgi:tRNA U-34 5-methylaminomethyl-2-thiouridine biosynthesis protein MnmC